MYDSIQCNCYSQPMANDFINIRETIANEPEVSCQKCENASKNYSAQKARWTFPSSTSRDHLVELCSVINFTGHDRSLQKVTKPFPTSTTRELQNCSLLQDNWKNLYESREYAWWTTEYSHQLVFLVAVHHFRHETSNNDGVPPATEQTNWKIQQVENRKIAALHGWKSGKLRPIRAAIDVGVWWPETWIDGFVAMKSRFTMTALWTDKFRHF